MGNSLDSILREMESHWRVLRRVLDLDVAEKFEK